MLVILGIGAADCCLFCTKTVLSLRLRSRQPGRACLRTSPVVS